MPGSNIETKLPPPGVNNIWYSYETRSVALVFVHGVLSDSRGCWLHTNSEDHSQDQYWPELVRTDPRLHGIAIYLGGYFTAIDAGPYEIQNCASELFNSLRRLDPEGRKAVLDYPEIVFVCHSTGGIVVRYLLDRYRESFLTKRIGLVLIASPSFGSRLADRLDWLARFYKNRVGLQLQWGSWSLKDLDARFKDLVHTRQIPGLTGVEAYENHFILHRKWLPDETFVVTEESAGRYFGAPVLLRQTDHFTSVKPDSFRHPAHELLVDFFSRDFVATVNDAPPLKRNEHPAPPRRATSIDEVPAEYELIALLHQGHSSTVFKCKQRSTGEVCVLKSTDSPLVSLRSLQALQELRQTNIITPRKVWVAGDRTWEELPYLEGTLLSNAVAKGVGGLTGSLLNSCHEEIRSALHTLHSAGLIYRDVHPDNLLLQVVPMSSAESSCPEGYEEFGQLLAMRKRSGRAFFLKWILLDSTFTILAKDAQTVPPIIHDWATPEEQTLGMPVFASDMYGFGATLYFGITGKEPPSGGTNNGYPSGQHRAVSFSRYLERLLAVSAADRPSAAETLNSNTQTPHYTGTIRLSDDAFIIVETSDGFTRLVTAAEALEFHRSMENVEYADKAEHQYWINSLLK